jgi:hypothetical protein
LEPLAEGKNLRREERMQYLLEKELQAAGMYWWLPETAIEASDNPDSWNQIIWDPAGPYVQQGGVFYGAINDKSVNIPVFPVVAASGILRLAECLCGPRDPRFTIRPYIFHADNPDVESVTNTDIRARLPKGSIGQLALTTYNLAHETVHLLYPSKYSTVTILEEGIAESFAMRYVGMWYIGVPIYSMNNKYDEARSIVEKALPRSPNGWLHGIPALRQNQTSLSKITPADLKRVYPDLEDDCIVELLKPFNL